MGAGIDEYRYYVIVRHNFSHRSGIFSLDELCDIMHSDYSYSSLHNGPGNDRRRYKQRLREMFVESFLFTPLDDGRFKINSERKLLIQYNGGNKTGWYEINDSSILASQKAFFDFCVGTLLSGNMFRANKNIAKYCGCSVRRIQHATSRNHKNKRFRKTYNFIEDFSGTWEDVQKFRAILLNVHHITSPLPFKKKGQWHVRLNAPNTYSACVFSGVKGHKAKPTESPLRKEECWFIPVKEIKDLKRNMKKNKRPRKTKDIETDTEISAKRWNFNERVYNADRYVNDHSGFLTGQMA